MHISTTLERTIYIVAFDDRLEVVFKNAQCPARMECMSGLDCEAAVQDSDTEAVESFPLHRWSPNREARKQSDERCIDVA